MFPRGSITWVAGASPMLTTESAICLRPDLGACTMSRPGLPLVDLLQMSRLAVLVVRRRGVLRWDDAGGHMAASELGGSAGGAREAGGAPRRRGSGRLGEPTTNPIAVNASLRSRCDRLTAV
jgi:hypothetical protein